MNAQNLLRLRFNLRMLWGHALLACQHKTNRHLCGVCANAHNPDGIGLTVVVGTDIPNTPTYSGLTLAEWQGEEYVA